MVATTPQQWQALHIVPAEMSNELLKEQCWLSHAFPGLSSHSVRPDDKIKCNQGKTGMSLSVYDSSSLNDCDVIVGVRLHSANCLIWRVQQSGLGSGQVDELENVLIASFFHSLTVAITHGANSVTLSG